MVGESPYAVGGETPHLMTGKAPGVPGFRGMGVKMAARGGDREIGGKQDEGPAFVFKIL